MTKVPDNLNNLIREACSHPPGSRQRQRRLTQVIRAISHRLCAHKPYKKALPYYEDALQKTWLYFSRNICEATTAPAYDSTKANVITWLNAHLDYRLLDGEKDAKKQRATTLSQSSAIVDMDGQVVDPIDRLPALPEVPPIEENTRAWIQSDPDQRLSKIHIKHHPHITCQMLLLKRFLSAVSWKELSAELGVSTSTLSSFYQRQCMPLLREYGHAQNYFEKP